jgi:uncharacterized membrane protein YfcA
MSATFILGALLAIVIMVRQMRWVVVIVFLLAVGYFAHNHMDYWPHEERRDRTIILRP